MKQFISRSCTQVVNKEKVVDNSMDSSSSESTNEDMAELEIQLEKNRSKEILNDIFRILDVSLITDM
jgi:hypothetical protein